MSTVAAERPIESPYSIACALHGTHWIPLAAIKESISGRVCPVENRFFPEGEWETVHRYECDALDVDHRITSRAICPQCGLWFTETVTPTDCVDCRCCGTYHPATQMCSVTDPEDPFGDENL